MSNIIIWFVFESDDLNYRKVSRYQLAKKKVENGSCLSIFDMILTFEFPVQSRGAQCMRSASQSPGLQHVFL